jgi:hypothetical protein
LKGLAVAFTKVELFLTAVLACLCAAWLPLWAQPSHKPHLVVVMFGMKDLDYGAVSLESDAARKAAFANTMGKQRSS